jgi:hypothetical protein
MRTKKGLCCECKKRVATTEVASRVDLMGATYPLCSICVLYFGGRKPIDVSEASTAPISVLLKPAKDTTNKPKPAKDTTNKPKLSYTFRSLMQAVALVREYGNNKYGSSENWKEVSDSDWIDAALRHLMAHIESQRNDTSPYDPESGILHLAHCVCSLMFVIENKAKVAPLAVPKVEKMEK